MTDSIYQWSTTAASNATADSTINWQENQDPSTVNNSARAQMARQAEFRTDLTPTRSTAGTSTAYTVTSASAPTALPDGFVVMFFVHVTNGGPATLAVNSYGAYPLRAKSTVELKSNELQIGTVCSAYWHAATSEWLVTNSGMYVNSIGPGILSTQTFGLSVGSPVFSLAPTPASGFIRLTEATQTLNKTDYPDLNSVVSGWGYPWGSALTTFNLPPAAGYFARFAGTTSAIDPSGPRSLGSTQTDMVGPHNHTATVTNTLGGTAAVGASGSTVGSWAGGGASRTLQSLVNGGSGNLDNINAPLTLTGSVSVAIASNGTAETRPKNVALALDVLAVPGLVSQGLIGAWGYAYQYSVTTTASDPGAGLFRFNSTTLASVTALYISKTEYNGASIASSLATWTSGSSSTKGRIRLVKAGNPAVFAEYDITGTYTDNTTYDTFTLVARTSSGTWADGDRFNITFLPVGDVGPASTVAGPQGASGIDGGIIYYFATSTTMVDPGSGFVRLNNATFGSVTAVAINYNTGDSGNPSVANWIKNWGASTSSDKGRIIIRKSSAPQNFLILKITAAVTDNTTWGQVTVTVDASAGTISANDQLSVQWVRTGNDGAPGAGSGDMLRANNLSDVLSVATARSNLGLVASATTDTTNASNISSGTLAAARGGAGTVNGIMKANGTGTVSAATAGTDYLAPPSGTSIQKANSSGALVNAVAGTDYQAPIGTITGLAKGNGANALTGATSGTDYMAPGTTSLITVGYTLTPYNGGTVSTGTTTPAAANGNYQYYTNNGAHTLAAPAADCAIDILVTNGATAGSITFSGFTVGSNTGDALTTTNTNKFIISIRRINAISTYTIKALQ